MCKMSPRSTLDKSLVLLSKAQTRKKDRLNTSGPVNREGVIRAKILSVIKDDTRTKIQSVIKDDTRMKIQSVKSQERKPDSSPMSPYFLLKEDQVEMKLNEPGKEKIQPSVGDGVSK